MAETNGNDTTDYGLAALTREVEQFVAAGGWDQPVQLFALVPTAQLLEQQPDLEQQLDTSAPLTPVAQESLPEGELDEALARIVWPDTVSGCALAQEIVVLPPEAEQALPEGEAPDDAANLRRAAANHPMRTEARLVAAVVRDGTKACVLRLRARETPGESPPDDEIIEHPELAPNLLAALETTLQPQP